MPRVHEPASSRKVQRSRRTGFAAWLLATVLAAQSLGAVEPIKTYPTLKLKDGRQFSAVQIVNYTTNGMLVRHAGGATTFRFDALPDEIIEALHLRSWLALAEASRAQAGSEIADRPAISDPAILALADRPAVTADETPVVADAPALSDETLANTVAVAAPDAHAVAVAAPESASARTVREAPIDPASVSASGEGNIPEFATVQAVTIATPRLAHEDLSGRVVVTSPTSGRHFLADVEIRGYPARLLAEYLVEAKNRAAAAARKLREESALAAKAGDVAEQQALMARAEKMTRRFLDFLPAAPAMARSDEFGFFTLRHSVADLRVVALGQVRNAQGEWNYEWVGLAPETELHLTEANATAVTSAPVNVPKYAAR